ncbi:MAG: threonine transporter [Acidobacteriia bacterium]|nr:threonine transporter [Terriglobia bacterium]
MAPATASLTPFNSPLETGIRALIVLAEAYPAALDLQRILEYDYLIVHSGDFEGPPSLHPALPLRSGELLVRRQLIERGLLLIMSRGLIERLASDTGLSYRADEAAGPFLDALSAAYLKDLKLRAKWVISTFGLMSDADIKKTLSKVYDQWTREFQLYEGPGIAS